MERKGRNGSEGKGRYQGGKGRAKDGREGGGDVREEPGRQREGGKRPGSRGKGQNVPFLFILALPFPLSLSPSLLPCPLPSLLFLPWSFPSLYGPFLSGLFHPSLPMSFSLRPLPSSPGPFLLYLASSCCTCPGFASSCQAKGIKGAKGEREGLRSEGKGQGRRGLREKSGGTKGSGEKGEKKGDK